MLHAMTAIHEYGNETRNKINRASDLFLRPFAVFLLNFLLSAS